MLKRKLIAHIGWPKTGTSAVQAFFNANRETLLDKYAILYPNIEGDHFSKGECFNHRGIWVNPLDRSAAAFEKIEKADPGLNWKIVLSSESPLRTKYIDTLKAMGERYNYDITILAYLRRQDKWVESAWKQWGLKLEGVKNIGDFVDDTLRAEPRQKYGLFLDYYERLKPWQEAFGKENIIIRVYEKEQLKGGVVDDISTLLGIGDGHALVKPGDSNRNTNPGLSMEALELLSISRSLFKDPDDNLPFEFIYQTFGDRILKSTFDHYSLLSPGQRIRILEKFSPQNELVARNYLGRPDGKLFYEKEPSLEDAWEPYPGISAEHTIPWLMEDTFHQYEELIRLRNKVDQLEKRIDQQNKKLERRGLLASIFRRSN